MTRSISVSLSLALHAVLLVGLLRLGWDRPRSELPAGIDVVWVETGSPSLAGPSRGDGGVAPTPESDPSGEALPETVVAGTVDDAPAPQNPDAPDPVSGADRPAPAPTVPADENRQRVADDDSEEDATRDVAEKAGAEPVPAAASADELAVAAPESAVERPSAVARPAVTAVVTAGDLSGRATARAPQAVDAAREAARPELVSIADAEREMLREEAMDLINRSRELPSRASAAWSEDGHEYRAEVTRVLSAGAMGIEEALIEISTERNGRHLSTEMRLKRLAFSHYAQLIDRWDPNVQIHDDEIDGRFHSNSEIVIANSGGIQPVFHGSVTTARGIDTSRSERRVRRREVFLGGLDTRVPRIALPAQFGPLEAVAADGTKIVPLTADTRISFLADGTYATEPIDGGGARRSGPLGSSPTYFVAAEKVTVAVEGTVDGKVLVYSPAEIVIEGDLVYAADPTRVPNSDDYLGLVSDDTVEIADPEVTGPGDLTIHAAIYAKRRFAVRRYSRAERATLFIYGSVTAGTLTATEPRYRTKLEFDSRLEEARPPSFPMTDRYELASWDGVWRISD